MSDNPGVLLKEIIDKIKPELLIITDLDSKIKRKPTRWSKREILGHLIDSAIVNHTRFINGSIHEEMIFSSYDQDQWVKLARYNSIGWRDIVELWHKHNMIIAEVLNSIPDDTMHFEFKEHNLDKICMKHLSPSSPATFNYLAFDYIAHLEHHLKQILNTYSPQLRDY
ncbi:MAG: DinB family protein [Cyclobacteriaceae bacterium]